LPSCFKQLRLEFGNKAPVWIADYSHAGAAGFPNITSLSADIVCGDPAKWIIPPWDDSKLAFFWLRTGPILEDCKQAFRPFFLSIDDRSDQLLARWVGSENIQTILSFLTRQSLNRSMLRQRHEDNMMLASTLAKDLGICAPVESSILWSEDGFDIDALPSWLKRRGLLWKPANQGMRILCRSDLKAHGMTS